MSQQINLYQPIFRKEKIVFSAQTIFWLGLGFVALLVLWSFTVDQRVDSLEAERTRQAQAEERAVAQLARLRETAASSQPSAELQARTETLRERRDELRESLQALEHQTPVAQSAMANRLDALARQLPRGMWLRGIEMRGNGQDISMQGRALGARLVPNYLQRLGEESALVGTGFRQVRLEAADDGRPGVRFVISTAEAES